MDWPPEVRRNERRWTDARGEAVVLTDGDLISFVEHIEFRSAGDVRGGHYHAGYRETLCLLSGRLRALFLRLDGEGIPHELEMEAGDAVTAEAGVAHRYEALAPARAVVFGSGSSPLEDRVPVPPERWTRSR